MDEQTDDTRQKSVQFLRQVSNGLRTPLNVIKGTADIAQTEIYDIETVKDGFRKIEESSEYLLNVVNDIVDYVAIENDELEIRHESFNLKNMINQFTAKYYTKSACEDKYLDTQIHGVVHENVSGDERYVTYILDCMLSNSLRYTNNKDRLYFRIYETGVTGHNVNMRFTLTGTNTAMYNSLSGTVNGKVVTDATDLALYNSHYILSKMGGSIEIVLDEDDNSVIIIDMVFDIANQQEMAYNIGLFEKEKILIISDDKDDALERGCLLDEMGVSFAAASEPDEALELIGAAEEDGCAFTICVVDWNLKSFIIQDFINEVHTIFGKNMAMIAMAYNDEKVTEQALKAGFDYVMKRNWFRSTVCDVLIKNTRDKWRNQDIPTKKAQYDFSSRHILVAEDAALNMEFIKKILRNVQADVSGAADGMEAYNIFKREPEGYFDCILMDVNMPEMDGYETTRRIRNSGRADARTIPIFALTANAFQSDVKKTIDAGMDGHFSKPVDIESLYAALDTVFYEVDRGIYRERHGDEEKARMSDGELNMEDPLTGLLSFHGFETRLETQRFVRDSMGFLFIDVNHFENIRDSQGSAAAEKLLKQVADCLREQFRRSDLLSYYGNGRFAAVLNYCGNGIEFVEKKIREINKEITERKKEMPNAGISVGAAYSPRGYSTQLVSLAEEALEHVRQIGNYGCYILNDNRENINVEGDTSVNKLLLGGQMYSFGVEGIGDVPKGDELLNRILGENQAVGVMCGIFDDTFSIGSASTFALSNLGYDADSFVKETKKTLKDIMFPEDFKMLREQVLGHEMETKKLRFRHKDGHIVWFNSNYISALSKNGVRIWLASFRPFDDTVVGNFLDSDYQTVSIIDHKENTVVFEKGIDAVYTGHLKLRNKYSYESIIKNVFAKMNNKDNREEYLYKTSLDTIISQINKKGIYEFLVYQIRDDGSSIPIRYKYRYLNKAQENILWTREEVENLAESDDITTLLNESGFCRNVELVLSREENVEREYVIVYMNIKDFKSVNNILGYTGGNFLLRKQAELLANSKLQPIFCGRFHADQFYMFLEKEKVDLNEIVSLCNRRESIDGHELHIRLHCGIYYVEDKDQTASEMCDKAVLAAESITNEYAMPYYVFDSRVNSKYLNKIFVLNNLDRAYKKDEFQVYYQPVCDTKTGKVYSAEALIRWIMPGGRVVSPGVFVPVLESKGYISRLDLLVSEKVKHFIELRSQEDKKIVPVSVNLSRMDFMNDTFLKMLKEQIDSISIDKRLFRYEVTESAYINVGEDGKNVLEEIRKNKSQIYIDDFGTGYSSLQNLMEVHFDVLKLDMYFIRRIGTNLVSEGIIKGAIDICHQLGRTVIAEGVETEEQYQFLLKNDCDYIQGYYFYKPMSEQEFADLLDHEA